MADTAIEITAGTGTNVDTRTEATNGNHRQVIVIGDPSTNAGVAPVDATNGLAVQIIPALPAGTNAIGKLAANSGVDIGDVDVTSCALPTGAATAAKQDVDAALLTTIDADTSTIAGDTTSIDGKITACNTGAIAGTVTANLSATDNAVLDTIDAVLDTINAKLVTGTVIGDVNLGATDNAVLDTIAAKDFATQTTLAAINTKLVTGTDIGDVTINNSTGASAVNIQDGGNTITVDGTVTANLSATDNTVLDDIAANQTDASQKTQLVDGSGNVIGATSNALDVNIKSGAGSGGTAAADDADFTAGSTNGTPAMGVYESSPTSVTDGDLGTVGITAQRALKVAIVSGAGSGGTASDDDADFTAGSTSGTPAMGVYESSPTSVTDGDVGLVGITATRALKTSTVLTAGTAAIGKLVANSGVDIGDVDVLSCALPTGASTAANQSTIIGHVDGVETLLTGMDVDTDAIKTAVQLLDNAVYVDDADWTGDTSSHLLVGGVYEAVPQTVTSGDVAPISLNINGAVRVTNAGGALTIPNIDSFGSAAIVAETGANQSIIAAPGANKAIWVYGGAFTISAAGTIAFQDEDDTVLTGVMPIDTKGGLVMPISGNFAMPYFKVATNKALEMDIVTGTVDGWLNYAIVSV
jgi:hypothetical protein